ncbi:MAG: thrombospondin type 3 repeat-containing protein, partial [Planctomycetes bacterium]|nr:thrombospondin type 3 repeat-containing protein [Planctomycetota bacterium]
NNADPDDDNDGTPDESDAFPLDPSEDTDTDQDGLGNNSDNCPLDSNPGQENGDSDAAGDVCDICPVDPNNDSDGDGSCDSVDPCAGDGEPTCVDGADVHAPHLWNATQRVVQGGGLEGEVLGPHEGIVSRPDHQLVLAVDEVVEEVTACAVCPSRSVFSSRDRDGGDLDLFDGDEGDHEPLDGLSVLIEHEALHVAAGVQLEGDERALRAAHEEHGGHAPVEGGGVHPHVIGPERHVRDVEALLGGVELPPQLAPRRGGADRDVG